MQKQMTRMPDLLEGQSEKKNCLFLQVVAIVLRLRISLHSVTSRLSIVPKATIVVWGNEKT